MRIVLTFLLSCMGLLAANPPIILNQWTTNVAPPVVGTNLGLSNNASKFMWKFYGYPDSNMVARLSDVSNILGSSSASITNAISSVWTNDAAVAASGASNIQFYGDGITGSNDPAGNVRLWFNYAETNEAIVWHDTIYGNTFTNFGLGNAGIIFWSDANLGDDSINMTGDGVDVFKFVDFALSTNLWCDLALNTWQFDHLPTVAPYGLVGLPVFTNIESASNSAMMWSSNFTTTNLAVKADTNSPTIFTPTFVGVLRGDRLAGTADASTYIDVGGSQIKLYRLGSPVMLSTNVQDALFPGTIIASYINSHPLSSLLTLNTNTFLHTNGNVFMLKSNFIGGDLVVTGLLSVLKSNFVGGQLVVTGAVESQNIFYGDGSGLSNIIGTGPYIEKSNGFGTNLSIKGFFGVQTTNFVVTNIATTYGAVGIRTQAPVATLHVWSEVARHALLVGSNATTPTLTVTNGAVGIGRPDPREALDLRGNLAVSGSAGVTNGLNVQGGFYTVNGAVYGTLQVTNLMGATANATALAINTNAATGVAVVQIAGGTNGMTGGYFSPTNQWVILYTNAIYATGWAVETNGNASAMATRQKYSLFQGLATGPTWAQVGQSNVFFQWGSNAVPPTAPPRLFGSYFDVDSNRVDKVMTEFP